MGECPFCGNKVDDDLITFGGTCPRCFAEIPGEEAATDPGEDVKAAQARKDQMRATLRTVLPVLFVIPIIAVLGLAALYIGVFRPEPEVVLLDFDEGDDYPIPELVAAAPEPEPEPANDGVAAAPEPTPVTTGAQASAAPAPVAQPAPVPARTPGGLVGVDVTASRRGTVLEDPDAIRKMIGEKLTAYAPRLNACYEKELKNNETLAGRWRIAFVVGADGKVRDAMAEPLSGSVASFESCLQGEVATWAFQRIGRDQPVRKTFTFRPAF